MFRFLGYLDHWIFKDWILAAFRRLVSSGSSDRLSFYLRALRLFKELVNASHFRIGPLSFSGSDFFGFSEDTVDLSVAIVGLF